MSQPSPDRTLDEVWSIVGGQAVRIALFTAGGMALAAFVSLLMPSIYRVDVSLVAGTEEAAPGSRPDLPRILGTWVFVLSDASAFDQAAERLEGRYETEAIRAVSVRVRPIDNSMVVVASVRAGSPELAADFARALYDAAEASELARPFPVHLLAQPQPPERPESPRTPRNILLGGAVGFLLGAALAFFVADRRRVLASAAQAARGQL